MQERGTERDRGSPLEVERSREAGIDHHLVKPPDLDVLRDLIASAPAAAENTEADA